MPRASPSTVVEQRLTLGSFERERLLELAKVQRRVQTGAEWRAWAQAILPSAAALGAGYYLYQGMIGWGSGIDKVRDNIRQKAEERAARREEMVAANTTPGGQGPLDPTPGGGVGRVIDQIGYVLVDAPVEFLESVFPFLDRPFLGRFYPKP